MTDTNDYKGERTITEYWASMGESNTANVLANKLPFGLGLFVYVPAYVAKVLNLGSATRYTLTNPPPTCGQRDGEEDFPIRRAGRYRGCSIG